MSKNDAYRRAVYERFADSARRQGVRWVMLHGAEQYPEYIGRDLDCLCATPEDTAAALTCFSDAAKAHPDTKWVLFPHPIWGKRCVAISAHYEAAELHILPGLASGPVGYEADFDSVDRSVLFPREEGAFFLKAIVMPLLGNSRKVVKAVTYFGEEKMPSCLQAAYRTLCQQGKISLQNRLSIYRNYCGGLKLVCRSLWHSLVNKVRRYAARTVPVFYFPETYRHEEVEAIADKLSEIFIRSVDCTMLSLPAIRKTQSLQFFLYTYRKGHPSDAIEVPASPAEALPEFIISEFERLTKR